MKKGCQFILLSTENVSEISIYCNKAFYVKGSKSKTSGFNDHINQHLYILSDDKIKEGDKCYDQIYKRIVIIKSIKGNFVSVESEKQGLKHSNIDNLKKVIATTNPELKISKYSHESQDLMKISVYKDEKLPSISQPDIEYIVNLYNTNKEKKTDKKFTLKDVYSILTFAEEETRYNERGARQFITGEVALNYRIVEEWLKEQSNDTVMVEYEYTAKCCIYHPIPKLKDGSIVIHQ